jgi:hypothetical protein
VAEELVVVGVDDLEVVAGGEGGEAAFGEVDLAEVDVESEGSFCAEEDCGAFDFDGAGELGEHFGAVEGCEAVVGAEVARHWGVFADVLYFVHGAKIAK